MIPDNQRTFWVWGAQRHMIRLAVADCGSPSPVAWWGQHTETITVGRSLSACVWLPPTHAHTDSSSHSTAILTLCKNRMTLWECAYEREREWKKETLEEKPEDTFIVQTSTNNQFLAKTKMTIWAENKGKKSSLFFSSFIQYLLYF